MAIETPPTLPTTGRVFVITIPDGEEWTAALIGALWYLCQPWYWYQGSGITIEAATQAWENVQWQVGHDRGEPE